MLNTDNIFMLPAPSGSNVAVFIAGFRKGKQNGANFNVNVLTHKMQGIPLHVFYAEMVMGVICYVAGPSEILQVHGTSA